MVSGDPTIASIVVLLNVAGLGFIAYLLVTRVAPAVDTALRETRATVDANTRSVNRLVRMWALWLVTERRDIPEGVRREARELLDETRGDAGAEVRPV